MFQSQYKDEYDLLLCCNVSHIKLSSNIIHYFLKTKCSFIYYSIGNIRNNQILDINSMRSMNIGIPHLKHEYRDPSSIFLIFSKLEIKCNQKPIKINTVDIYTKIYF